MNKNAPQNQLNESLRAQKINGAASFPFVTLSN
jgi:hypothetical protein